ncbi:hypothetical protein CTI12_AA287630 [Artemisia annua]|uniref:Uncharacterized protein n=1 Tax=Artemisia annua TaxID=35608 RepID=A0A2U1NAL8_ARTAN|nr:hypothetical protein CTI12_AA287630 [Artemisia annua]
MALNYLYVSKWKSVVSPSDELTKEVVAASEVVGEHLWRMPMEVTSYWECMESVSPESVRSLVKGISSQHEEDFRHPEEELTLHKEIHKTLLQLPWKVMSDQPQQTKK